jgi:CP family cyanate transporter-like MFS transporter
VLTTMPVLAFAIFGAMAPWMGRRVGVHRVTLLSLGAVLIGLSARPFVDSAIAFLLLSFLALAGTATANVHLPSLVKLHFPHRVGLLTALYTTAIALGITAGSALTVPIAQQFGSWRWGLLAWAFVALVVALPWLALFRYDRVPAPDVPTMSLGLVGRTRLGWAMAGFFACQSLQAFAVFGWFAQIYRDAGFSAGKAGLLLGVITAVGIPISFWIPKYAARAKSQASLIVGLTACYPIGYLGLLVAPVDGAWLWAVVIGASTGAFPLILTLISLRARTDVGTAALSGFTQSVGYLVASIGPFGIGLLFDMTGTWTVPLIALVLLGVPQLITGLIIANPAYIEDALPRPEEVPVSASIEQR